MNGPFFRNYSNQQPSRSARFVPVQQTPQRASPKVVSVPIHFISSDQPRTTLPMLKDSAAIKIQKVFRGFIVRKSVKKVASIRNEVDEIERRISGDEVIDLIRRDEKERLRVNETLMSLLFKLDSIRGVDLGVRALRKAVTRKAIALQEKVDSIAQADCGTLDSVNDSGEIDLQNVCKGTSGQVAESSGDAGNLQSVDEGMETIIEEETEVQKDNDDKGNRELVEKLMADNGKMMKAMMQISERNEMQTRMINSLSRRVEQLEKAFTNDRLRRKKTKKTHVALRRDKDHFCYI